MLFKHLLSAAALASSATAASLSDVLASHNSTLSRLNSILSHHPDIAKNLEDASNVTFLAPSNDAFGKFFSNNSYSGVVLSDAKLLAAVLSYHVLNGTWYASNFSSSSVFPHTLLPDSYAANVTGGQVVEAALTGSGSDIVTFWSAFKENATVTQSDLNFTGGTVHVIDTVMTFPSDLNDTLISTNLRSADGALRMAGDRLSKLGMRRDLTVFAPYDAAFSDIANIAANWTSSQIADIFDYHVIDGTVYYSTLLQNDTQATMLSGGNVTFTVDNGTVFVNSARIIEKDVLLSNGVLHIIDGVLNPENTTAKPDTSASTDAPAFSGATAAPSSVPFTSGVPMPTTTLPAATGAMSPSSSESSALAVPMHTRAVSYAALFGGAAILANL